MSQGRLPLPAPQRSRKAPGVVVLIGLLLVDVAVMLGRLNVAWVSQVDLSIHNWFLAVRTPAGAQLVTDFTNLGQTVPMLIIGLAATGTLFLIYRRAVVWPVMLIVPIGSVGLTESLKAIFRLARPDSAEAVAPFEGSFSFPSGHTLNSTAIIGALAYLTAWLARRAWIRVAAVLAASAWILAMGLSRVYLGHHWLSDVAFGWSLGLTWLTIVILAHRTWLANQRSAGTEGSP